MLAATLLVAACGAVTGAHATAPLRLALACSQGADLTFRLTLENVSARPAAVVVGVVLGNDKAYLLNTGSLTVRRRGAPDPHLQYFNPSFAAIGGRLDPWLVALPAGASYSIAVPARHFVSRPDRVPDLFANPVSVQARLETRGIERPNLDMQALRSIDVWVGTLTSDWIDVPGGCAG